MTYTAFCQETNGTGTIWISAVEAENLEDAITNARKGCAADWNFPIDKVHVLGIAAGDVTIEYWEDN